MKKQLLFITILLGFPGSLSWSDGVGFLTNIINRSPYNAIAIQTTDREGTVTLKDKEVWTGDRIQNKQFHLWDVESLRLTIPWEGWDGSARIYIDLKENMENNKTLITRGELMERDGYVLLYSQKNYNDSTQKLVQRLKRNQESQYTIIFDANGNISMTDEVINYEWSTVKAPSTYVGTCVPVIGAALKQKDACNDWCSGQALQWKCDGRSWSSMKCVCAPGVTPGSHNIFNKIADVAVDFGNLINENVIKKPREMAHAIAASINGVADKISSTPNTITQKASQIIGNASTPDLSAQLQGGVNKLDTQIKSILATIATVQSQKNDVKKQNLAGKGISELKQLNTMLIGDATTVGAFDAVVEALNELVSADCKTGVLCEIQNAFKSAVPAAKNNEEIIKANIKELERKINNPNLKQDGVKEPLPTRLHNMAKLLNI